MSVSDILIFGKVATTRSFTIAADQLGLTRSAISKSVTRLEKKLGVKLLNRSPRRVSLTEPGAKLLHHSRRIEKAVERAVDSVNGADQLPKGHVSCSLPSSLGATLMPAIIQEFRPEWPDISLNLHFDERAVDLVGGGFDVAIRIARKLDDSNLLCRRFASTPRILVASKKYLDEYGVPKSVDDLSNHRCIGFGRSMQRRTNWHFDTPEGQVEIPVKRVLTANNDLPLILAACLGDGIVYIPKALVSCELAQGRLQEISLDSVVPYDYGIYAVYTNKKPPAKTRAFINFVDHALRRLEMTDRWAPFATFDSVR